MAKSAKPIRGDDDEDRPRKFKKKTNEGPPKALVLGGIGLAVVLVGAAAAAAYFLRPKPKPAAPTPEPVASAPDKPAPAAPPKPAFEWKTAKLSGLAAAYQADFPNGPPTKIDPFEAVKDDRAVGMIQSSGLKLEKWEATADGQTYTVTAFKPPATISGELGGELKALGIDLGGPPDALEMIKGGSPVGLFVIGPGRRLDETDAELSGVKYRQMTIRDGAKQAVVRIYGLKDVAIALRVEGPGLTADSERVKHFFEYLVPARR